MLSPRMQRWALTLSMYEYTTRHRAGKENQAADALSRLPLKTKRFQAPVPGETVCLIETMGATVAEWEHSRLPPLRPGFDPRHGRKWESW